MRTQRYGTALQYTTAVYTPSTIDGRGTREKPPSADRIAMSIRIACERVYCAIAALCSLPLSSLPLSSLPLCSLPLSSLPLSSLPLGGSHGDLRGRALRQVVLAAQERRHRIVQLLR